MKIFSVYRKKSELENDDAIQDSFDNFRFVEQGFSFWGFLFNLFWLLYNRIWLFSILFILILVAVEKLYNLEMIGRVPREAANIFLSVYIGYSGKDWIEQKLTKSGYELYDIVVASNVDDARSKLLHRNLDSQVAQSQHFN